MCHAPPPPVGPRPQSSSTPRNYKGLTYQDEGHASLLLENGGLGLVVPLTPHPLAQNFKCLTYKDEGHAALFPRHRGLGLVVPLNLDSDHARLVNNLLDESTVFTNDFTNKASWNLKYELEHVFINLQFFFFKEILTKQKWLV